MLLVLSFVKCCCSVDPHFILHFSLTAVKYRHFILSSHVVPTAAAIVFAFIFMDNNARPHRAKALYIICRGQVLCVGCVPCTLLTLIITNTSGMLWEDALQLSQHVQKLLPSWRSGPGYERFGSTTLSTRCVHVFLTQQGVPRCQQFADLTNDKLLLWAYSFVWYCTFTCHAFFPAPCM